MQLHIRSQQNGNIQYEDFLQKIPGSTDKGNYIFARCPFHDDRSPSLLIFKDGWYHCLAANCSVSGPWIWLWNKISGQPFTMRPERRISYSTPRNFLNDPELSVEDFAYQAHMDLIGFPNYGWYLESRGLADAIELHELGYHRGWYTIPVRDREGKFESLVFRASPPVQYATEYRYWSDFKPGLYVPDWKLAERCDHLIVVFGIFDALTLNKYRFPVVTPTHGHTFDNAWLKDFRKQIFVLPDKGEESSALGIASNLGVWGKMVYLDFPKGMKDANDFLMAGKEKELLAQLETYIR